MFERYPVTVSLGHAGLTGDVGHARVDAGLLTLMLIADGRSARLLRAHGVDEAPIRAALGYPPSDA
jgi:hypothetical protein